METHTVHKLEDSIYLKCQFSPKLIYRFNIIPVKILAEFFVNTSFSTICTERQRNYNSQNDFENEEQSWRTHATDF